MELLNQTPANLAKVYGMEATILLNQDDINGIVFAITKVGSVPFESFQILHGLLSDLVSES